MCCTMLHPLPPAGHSVPVPRRQQGHLHVFASLRRICRSQRSVTCSTCHSCRQIVSTYLWNASMIAYDLHMYIRVSYDMSCVYPVYRLYTGCIPVVYRLYTCCIPVVYLSLLYLSCDLFSAGLVFLFCCVLLITGSSQRFEIFFLLKTESVTRVSQSLRFLPLSSRLQQMMASKLANCCHISLVADSWAQCRGSPHGPGALDTNHPEKVQPKAFNRNP